MQTDVCKVEYKSFNTCEYMGDEMGLMLMNAINMNNEEQIWESSVVAAITKCCPLAV